MEKEIFLIGVRKIHSEKKQKDYYMVDYVKDDQPCTDYITIEEFNKIGGTKKTYCKCLGIFALNNFNKGYLCDVK